MKITALPALALFAPMLIVAAKAQMPAAPAAAVKSDLPAGPNRDLVEKTCTGCHSTTQFSTQRLSRAEWDAMVVQMVGYGANVPEDKQPLIVDYLATNLGPAK